MVHFILNNYYKVYPFSSKSFAQKNMNLYSDTAQLMEIQKGYFIIKVSDNFYVDRSGGFNTKEPLISLV